MPWINMFQGGDSDKYQVDISYDDQLYTVEGFNDEIGYFGISATGEIYIEGPDDYRDLKIQIRTKGMIPELNPEPIRLQDVEIFSNYWLDSQAALATSNDLEVINSPNGTVEFDPNTDWLVCLVRALAGPT